MYSYKRDAKDDLAERGQGDAQIEQRQILRGSPGRLEWSAKDSRSPWQLAGTWNRGPLEPPELKESEFLTFYTIRLWKFVTAGNKSASVGLDPIVLWGTECKKPLPRHLKPERKKTEKQRATE